MGVSHYILLTLHCVSYSPKRARLWQEFLCSLSTSGLQHLWPVLLLGFSPAREFGATAKAVTITQRVTPATCLVLVEPYHSFPLTPLSFTGLCPCVSSDAPEIFQIWVFYTVMMYSYKLSVVAAPS